MSKPLARNKLAVVMGVNEIASAVALWLHRAGYRAILTHDPDGVVIRRRMAFHDALFGDVEPLEGVTPGVIENGLDLLRAHAAGGVHVTRLGLSDLLAVGHFQVLVDARMQKYKVTPDLRGLAALTIGLGPGFSSDVNCDAAVETRPGFIGAAPRARWTQAADRRASQLGGTGAERFVYSPFAGRWRTALDIGAKVYKNVVLGHLDGAPLMAPCDGILRGLARDGVEIPGFVKVVEVDPRGRNARWTGTDERGSAIAEAALRLVETRFAARQVPLTLVN